MAFVTVNAEYPEFILVEAAAGPPVSTATRENIEEGDFLCQANWIVECRQRDAGSYTKVSGCRGEVNTHHVDGRTDAIGREVMLSDPDSIVTILIHDTDSLQGAIVYVLETATSAGPAEKL